ncbi:hypothetical protein BS78_09G084100 [Paspalum vaginatum]|nr:hypothetical protein BS78_09G084100 [Paspalum vaginatum]
MTVATESDCRCQQRHFPGHKRRRGSCWDVRSNHLAVEGVDFAQDTQEGGADEYMFIPDSDDKGFQGIISTEDGEFVPETKPHDVATMVDNDGEISNQRAHSPKVDQPSVTGTTNQDIVKSKETMSINIAGHLQEREYEVMDDFQLELIRLVLPGYVPWSKEKFYAMANCSSVEQRKLEEGKESEEEMPMNLATYSQEEEMSMDLAPYSQEEEYEPLDESQLKLVRATKFRSRVW